MKTVTMQFARYNLGAMLHEIKHHGEEYLLTKHGKPIAKLVPDDDSACTNLMGKLGKVRK